MRIAGKFLVLGATVLAVALPSSAAAERSQRHAEHARSHERSGVIVHLFFDGAKETDSSTGFTSTSSVSYGSSVRHGPVVGQATLTCTFLTDSKASCNGLLVIYKRGTVVADKSVFFNNLVIDPSTSEFPLQGGTGDWAWVHSGVVKTTSVSDTASNVVAILAM